MPFHKNIGRGCRIGTNTEECINCPASDLIIDITMMGKDYIEVLQVNFD